MDQLTKLFEGHEVRIFDENGQPTFVASDVAKVLGYVNVSKAISDHCKGVTKRYTLTSGGKQEINVIYEADLYRLIFKSKLPAAERFEKWVMNEVLPSIRRDGAYVMAQPDESPEIIMARGLIAAQATIERMKQEQAQVLETIEEQKPLVAFAEIVERSSDSILVREFAKVVSKRGFIIGEKKLFKRLRHCKYLDKKNMPYQRYIDQGIFEVMERPIPNPNVTTLKFTTRITGKGQIYLYNKLLTGELHDEL